MPVYVDTPRWQRHHGLSGHLIADSVEELDAFGAAFGLSPKDRSIGSVIPHFLLASSRRDAAIAAGAIPLAPAAWATKLSEIDAEPKRGRPHRPQRQAALAKVNRPSTTQLGLFGTLEKRAG